MFKLFSWQYFLYIFLAIAIVLTLVFVFRKSSEKTQKIAKITLVSTIVAFAVLEYIGRLLMISEFEFGEQMPINTHHVFAIISLYTLLTSKSSWYKFSYLVITPVCAYQLLFVPEIYSLGSPFSLAIVCYVLTNALLMANSVLNMFWLEDDLEKRNILDASLTYVILIAFIHIVNIILRFSGLGIHANYFGTMGDSYDLVIGWLHSLMPVTDMSVAVPLLCILPLLAILVGVQFLLVLPFEMVRSKKQAQQNMEELIALGNLKKQQEYREQYRKKRSQILLKSENKAKPKEEKRVSNSTSSGFVTTNKTVQVNNKNDNDK